MNFKSVATKALLASMVIIMPGGFLIWSGIVSYKGIMEKINAVRIKTRNGSAGQNKDEKST